MTDKDARRRARALVAARQQADERLIAHGTINLRRITQALDAGGHEGPEVDQACGVQEPVVDEWEAGTRTPTREQLGRLADLTGVTVAFFYLPDPPPMHGFLCQRSGPGKGCHPFDTRPAAPVAPLHPDTLF